MEQINRELKNIGHDNSKERKLQSHPLVRRKLPQVQNVPIGVKKVVPGKIMLSKV